MGLTRQQITSFIAQMGPIAVNVCNKKSRKVLPSVCIAQACCESACGTSTKMKNANALFGIKVGNSKAHFGTAWKDKAYSTKTKECYDGKTYTQITDMFRAYDSIEDATEDYYDMLGACSRYAGAIGLTDALACITAIKNAGYATSPTYISTIMKYINDYNLRQYDACMPSAVISTQTVMYYTVGKNYILQSNMYVRVTAAGVKKKYDALTTNAKQNAYKNAEGYGVLKAGTKVTCQGTVEKDGAIWIKIPSGFVCAKANNGTVYIK